MHADEIEASDFRLKVYTSNSDHFLISSVSLFGVFHLSNASRMCEREMLSCKLLDILGFSSTINELNSKLSITNNWPILSPTTRLSVLIIINIWAAHTLIATVHLFLENIRQIFF